MSRSNVIRSGRVVVGETVTVPGVTTASVPKKEKRDLTVNAIGLIKTDDGWVSCTFKVPLSLAVKVSEPDVRLVGVENFKRSAAAIIIGDA